jgi:hypothetical protein
MVDLLVFVSVKKIGVGLVMIDVYIFVYTVNQTYKTLTFGKKYTIPFLMENGGSSLSSMSPHPRKEMAYTSKKKEENAGEK